MVSTKVSSVLLVQIASLFAGAAARCVRACPASDSLLVLLRNEDAIPFCIDFLNIPVSQVEVTVTPTVISSTTATSYITEFVSDISTSTATVTSSVRYSIIQDKRAVPVYPEWLPVTYGERRVSSACHCLSISAPVVTSAVTADAVTSTATTTVTDQITSTIHSTVIATQTVAPPKPISNRQVGIEVLVASTESPGALVSKGWLHMSGGDAQVLKNTPEQTFKFTVPPGATSAERVRITHPYISAGNALGVSTYSNIEYDVGGIQETPATPPGSAPVADCCSDEAHESDIFTVDTVSRIIGMKWVRYGGGSTVDIKPYYFANADPNSGISGSVLATANPGAILGNGVEAVFRYTAVEES